MTQTRRDFLRSSALLSAAFAMPWQAAMAQTGTRAPVFKWVPHADLSVVDPMYSTALITQLYSLLTFDTLFGLDENYEAQPQMAESHSVENDGLQHTITLRDGLKFHNGDAVTAADCVASIERWFVRGGTATSLAAAVDSVTVVDDKTFVFALNTPFPLLPALLARPQNGCTIMPASEAASADRIDRPTGSGPYKMVWDEWVQGAKVVFARFEDYVPREGGEAVFTAGAKIAMVDRIEWLVIPDAATAVAALQAGEVDGIEGVSLDFAPILQMMPGFTLYRNAMPQMGVLRFNQLHAPFNDIRVRQAVQMAVSQQDFMYALAGAENADYLDVHTGAFVPGTPMASDRGMAALDGPRDLEAAKALLREAGAYGATITLIDSVSIASLHSMALIGADLLRRLDFDVKVETLDWGASLQKREVRVAPSEGGWNVFFTIISGTNNLDPIGQLAIRGRGEAGWFGWPTSERIEELYAQWMAAATQDERIEIAAQMQEQMFVDVPYIPLGCIYGVTAVTDKWTGVQTNMPTFYTLRG
ncbi:ABC transporter substrate-binding protein [Ketogulonicigenium vulgare]|uniref:Bacterial extracellular solute-binding protein n=1 Tax=Ketogulonicigenium vulgare (strain WSH-001) TaxID=759362 RepID=F9Y613_KETVW|nr:ABC transporter substrate-binding protein [Ketogulonicigenium vulgare]ADO42646.1 extracellular solute-binding protein [Ketogulonicigenium vulgare Y25]AEM40838.1 Bacterial extracellular solute-binding protein [Ketogulonicigenium vulgare WSH-001]ALJ81001.1 ABC transporter substrate-binding protein [Ketogulonicigenium vulgare]ANW33767.1 ABC transporter substrate-binding protein [Ketogulonicigenium vulgare]AOZ54556.1 extracellular solute-binding protein [Ketogulonicigenium vulgare]